MNAKQIRENITVEEVLAHFGYSPKVRKTNQLKYLSPFREETEPSFFVDENKNVFKDFGNGYGGSPIDLVMKLKDLTFTETIQYFNENFSIDTTISVSKIPQKRESLKKEEEKVLELNEVKSLKNYYLTEYIQGRGIDLDIAKENLKEVYFTLNKNGEKKNLYALGFKNNIGGYELRNSFYKGNINGKDITYIKNSQTRDKLVMFEGFIDYLSYLTLNKSKGNNISNENFVILNTTSFVIPFEKIEEIKEDSISQKLLGLIKEYSKVETYFDNDDTGKKITSLINDVHTNAEDKSTLYANYNDLNEYFTNLPKTKKLTI